MRVAENIPKIIDRPPQFGDTCLEGLAYFLRDIDALFRDDACRIHGSTLYAIGKSVPALRGRIETIS